MSTSPSPYSAPNTPIASSKRARLGSHKKENQHNEVMRSPIRKLKIDDADERDGVESRKPSLYNPSLVTNALFSPLLKFGANAEETGAPESEEGNVRQSDSSQTVAELVIENTNLPEVSTNLDEKEEEEEEFNPYLFIWTLPPHSTVVSKDRQSSLPRSVSCQQLTLVLDLDETLVHCTIVPVERADIVFPVTFNGVSHQVFVKKRPYLDYFLETVSKMFEVVVFTASQKVYAEQLLDLLDPQKLLIQHRLYRESCLCVYGNFIKDLEILNRDLSRTILVDNSPHAYGYQVNNGVPIESWFDDETDTELLKLIGFLRRLQQGSTHQDSSSSSTSTSFEALSGSRHTDVRDVIREHFKTYSLIEKAASGQPVLLTAPPF